MPQLCPLSAHWRGVLGTAGLARAPDQLVR